MNSAFLYFNKVYIGNIITLYECHVCFSLVLPESVPAHFSAHGIA